MLSPLTDLTAELRERLDAIETGLHTKLDAGLRALHHLITRTIDMDHAALLDLAKTIDADVDTAVANFQALQTSHDTVTDALDDVGAVLSAIPAKLAKITPAPTSSTVTVAAPTTAPATIIPVSDAASVVPGSTVAGAGIPTGATVTGSNVAQSTITIDTPTTTDHTGDGSESLTITPPVS